MPNVTHTIKAKLIKTHNTKFLRQNIKSEKSIKNFALINKVKNNKTSHNIKNKNLNIIFQNLNIKNQKHNIKNSRNILKINNNRFLNSYVAIYTFSVALLILSLGIIIPFYISETKTEAAAGAATQSTISLSLSSNNIALNLLQPGTYDTNNLESGIFGSASTTASVSTTNYTGYTLSIAATNNNGSGNANNYSKLIDSTNSDTSRNYFDSITSAVSESDFSANTVAAGNNYNGKWGYKPSYYNSVINNNYLPAPSTAGATINTPVCPNATSGSTGNPTTNCTNATDTYTFTLGARANINQSAGSYSNTFNIVATANPVTYSITYSDNSGDSSVTNLPSMQASSLNAQSKLNTSTISLSSTIPTRTGYTFNKWCLGSVSNSGTTCTGTEYSAGSNFGIDQTTNNQNITLYATWSIKTNLSLIINFDTGVSSVAVKSGSTTGTTIGTVSTSGGSVSGLTYKTTYYLVPTYASGKKFSSWTQNNVGTGGSGLSSTSADTPSFNIGDGTNAATLTSEDDLLNVGNIKDYTLAKCKTEASSTDVLATDERDGKTYTVRYINDACWMTQNLAYTGTSTDAVGQMTLNTTTSNIDRNKTITYEDLTLGNSYSNPRLHAPNYINDSAVLERYSSGQIGIWYNYAISTGGTITGYSYVTALYDICPKNWHLPNYNVSPGAVSGITSAVSVFNPIDDGFYHDGILNDVLRYGVWWTNVSNSSDSSIRHDLLYEDGNLSPNYGYASSGFHIRCVRTDDRLQDMNSNILAGLMPTAGSSVTLVDIRDNQKYKVAKLKDDKYWMTTNLNLAGGSTIGSADTDVTDTYISNMGTISGFTVDTANKTITLPSSSTSGFSDNSTAYVYNSNSTVCNGNVGCYSYYSWTAATLGGKTASGSNVTGDGYNSVASICPKNWTIPTSTTEGVSRNNGGYAGGDYYKLAIRYGMTAGNYVENPDNSPTFYSLAGPGTIPSFVVAGYYNPSGLDDNDTSKGSGNYWSSSSGTATAAYYFAFRTNTVWAPADYTWGSRRLGFSVRCLFAG